MSGGILGGILGGDQANFGTGILGNVNATMRDNAGTLLGLGAGLLSGDWSAASQGAMQGMQQDQRTRLVKQAEAEKEQKKVAAQQIAQQLGLPPAFANDPDAVFSMAQSLEMKKRTPKEYSLTEQWLLKQPQDVQDQYFRRQALGGSDGLSLNPIYGKDAQGNTVLLQVGKDGRAVQTQVPGGIQISSGVDKVDLGTRWGLLDKRSGQIVGYEAKDLNGAEREKATGKAEGEAIAGAPQQRDAATAALEVIEQIKTHPGMSSAVGWQAQFPTFAGSKAAGFENLVEQAKSGAFSTAIQQLRGLGAMSEQEGKAATASINRMNVATSEADFMAAVRDYEAIVRRAQAKAEALMAGKSPAEASNATAPQPSGNSNALKQKYGLE